MNKQKIETKINKAITKLIENDSIILKYDINERSISHKLAVYLEPLFPGYDVDCEYNRNHDDPKRLHISPRNLSSNDIQARTVFPDIIVHKRGYNDNNLLVIEMKKTTSTDPDEFDFKKLKAFKSEL